VHAGPTLTEVVKYEDGCFSNMHIVHVVTECFTAMVQLQVNSVMMLTMFTLDNN